MVKYLKFDFYAIMDIKDLNKGQFILLIILVCFVVSIATSITTYSLLSGLQIVLKT